MRPAFNDQSGSKVGALQGKSEADEANNWIGDAERSKPCLAAEGEAAAFKLQHFPDIERPGLRLLRAACLRFRRASQLLAALPLRLRLRGGRRCSRRCMMLAGTLPSTSGGAMPLRAFAERRPTALAAGAPAKLCTAV